MRLALALLSLTLLAHTAQARQVRHHPRPQASHPVEVCPTFPDRRTVIGDCI